MRLLVVDDDLHIRRLVGIYLRDAGYDVTEAASGEEALQASHAQAFDVVLIDLILPQYGGFRLCEKLKSLPDAPRIVITTGDAYAGPSPSHFHLPSPLLRSYATIAPFPRPPRWATHMPSTMSGELET